VTDVDAIRWMPIRIRAGKLAAFGDRIRLRDTAARSATPRLRRQGRSDVVAASGAFLIHHEYRTTRDEGRLFVDVTNDPNSIHREGNVVAGAMTMARVLLPMEVLMPGLAVQMLNVKFTSAMFYGDRAVNVFRFAHEAGPKWKADVLTYQGGRIAAKTTLVCRATDSDAPGAKVREWRVHKAGLKSVQAFCHALRIDPEGYLDKDGARDYTYPLSFLASLPSGAIVEQMSGEGGILNSLRLEFADCPKLPIVGRTAPSVQLEQQRKRPSFNKILANIVQGIVTCCKGHAIVYPDAGLALDETGQ